MANRLKRAMFALCIFLGYCAQSFASGNDPFRKTPVPLTGWNEPLGCLHVDKDWNNACVIELNRMGLQALDDDAYEIAIARFSQILQIERYAIVLHNRATAHFRKGDLKSARADWWSGLKLDYSMAASWHGLARVDLEEKHFTHALIHASLAVGLDSKSPTYLELRAKIYNALKKPTLADADMLHALALRKSSAPDTHVTVGTTEAQ